MPDELYWDAFEELSIILNRDPEYEEVIEYWQKKYTITEEERRNAAEKIEERRMKWKKQK